MRPRKCEKSSPTASVADVKIQAPPWARISSPSLEATSNGVNASEKPPLPGSTQRIPASVPESTIATRESASLAQRSHTVAQRRVFGIRRRQFLAGLRQRFADLLERGNERIAGSSAHSMRSRDRRNRCRGFANRRLECHDALARGRAREPEPRELGERVTREERGLARRELPAEELRGDLGHLVRLVEDHGFRARQQLAEAFVLQREVGEQQVMIDDHDVGGLRLAPGRDDVASRIGRTSRAEAVLPG